LGLNYDQHLLNDQLDVKVNLKGSRTNDQFTPNGALGEATSMAPTQPVYDPTNTQGFNTGYWDWATERCVIEQPDGRPGLGHESRDHLAAASATCRPITTCPGSRGCGANLNLGYDVTQANSQSFAPSTLADQTRQGHGYLNLSNPEQLNSVLEAYLNYASPLTFIPGNIDLTGGYSYSLSHSEYPASVNRTSAATCSATTAFRRPGRFRTPKYVNDSKLISFFGRLNYKPARPLPHRGEHPSRRFPRASGRTTRGARSPRYPSAGGSRKSRSSGTSRRSRT